MELRAREVDDDTRLCIDNALAGNDNLKVQAQQHAYKPDSVDYISTIQKTATQEMEDASSISSSGRQIGASFQKYDGQIVLPIPSHSAGPT
jgi:hypothetical protein